MENNGYNNAQGQQNGAVAQQNGGEIAANNVVSFPGSDDTNLQDISTLLGGAPVLQPEPPANATAKSAIASEADFEQLEEKRPFAHKIGPKTILGAGAAALVILPMSLIFMGGIGHKNKGNQTATEIAPVGEEPETTYVSPDDYAAMQAEVEQLRSQQAFTDQQVDAEAIDAAGRQSKQGKPTTTTAQPANRSTSTTASRPAPTTTAASPSNVTVRPAPARAVAAAPVQRSAPAPVQRATPVATAPRSTAPVAQAVARKPEPVDPFERRAQLQALGTYGAPPPTAQAAARPVSYEAANPFETEYIQTIAMEAPQAQPAVSRTSTEAILQGRDYANAPTQGTPLTEEEFQYQQDAAAVLAAAPTEAPEAEDNSADIEDDVAAVLEPDDTEAVESEQAPEASSEQPTAIMPGTSTEAELPYGFSWQEGTPLPEVLLTTTEDVMAGELAVIPTGSQFLGQAQIDPASGAVTIQVVGLFGETRDVQISRSSVIVQAEDGSVLTAKASGGSDRTSSGSNVGGFLMESLGNGLGNVINSDGSLVGDLAGGVAETVIDGQVERSQNNAANRNSRAAARPVIWTLGARPVRLTFNNFIPLSSTQY